MRIVTLIENTTERADLTAEHGLSLYMEACGKKILFDAGQSGAFADNAEKLGVDLSQVDFAVLSHGHYDHGGGMRRFLELNSTAPLYINSGAFRAYHNAAGKYIGLDPTLMECGRVILTDEYLEIAECVRLGSCNDCYRPWPTDSAGLTMEVDGVRRPDDFQHEQYLLLEEDGKTVLISGCSHKGILNIAGWFQPGVLVGGFHFMKLDPGDERLAQAARRLLAHPTTYYTGHCTGREQYDAMKRIMGDRLHSLTTGKEIII